MSEKNLKFEPTIIKNYEFLKQKLKMILSANKQVSGFNFFGVKCFDSTKQKETRYKYGLLVMGVDNRGVRNWSKFFSIGDINEKYRNWCQREKLDEML